MTLTRFLRIQLTRDTKRMTKEIENSWTSDISAVENYLELQVDVWMLLEKLFDQGLLPIDSSPFKITGVSAQATNHWFAKSKLIKIKIKNQNQS